MRFVNISNHPSDKWSDKQKQAAMELTNGNEIVDIAFPNVNPTFSKEDIEKMVSVFITKNTFAHDDVFHVMGEMGFTYKLVQVLKSKSHKVYHSTTERKVTENNGIKTVIFAFVQFRSY